MGARCPGPYIQRPMPVFKMFSKAQRAVPKDLTHPEYAIETTKAIYSSCQAEMMREASSVIGPMFLAVEKTRSERALEQIGGAGNMSNWVCFI